MRVEKFVVLAICVLAAAVFLGMRAFSDGPSDSAATPQAGVKLSGAGEFRGISLQLHTGYPANPWEQYVDQIAATGANTLCVVVAAYQENCSSTSIFVDLRKTPSDDRVKAVIAHARKLGLRVVLMPIVLLENPREGEWRGKIDPTSWDDWWDDYENYIMHYAWLAESARADVFMVGSELVSTESDTKRWRDLIARVRGSFDGRLGYSANWDHYKEVKFWDDLDIIGMTTYHELGAENPTVAELVANWKPIKEEILKWQRTVHRPLLFTEVGWPNQTTCAKYPWDYYRSVNDPDPAAQANCFEAFFETWASEPAVAGWLIWEWRSYPGQDTDPRTDTSYVPCDKPAMDVIARYFHGAATDHEIALPAADTRPAIAAGSSADSAAPPHAAGD